MPHTLLRTIFVVPILLITFISIGAAQGRSEERSGVLDISKYDLYQDGNIRLDGKWEFFWDSVKLPEEFKGNVTPIPDGYYAVPKYWTAYKGLSLPAKGRASYRLVIKLSTKNQPLSLLTPEIFTHYHLFINGQPADRYGDFKKENIRFLSPRIFTFYNNSDTIEILLNIENHLHSNAGIGQSFFIGSPENIRKQNLFSIITEMVLVAVCLFAGIYHILLFTFRRKEKELLYFGVFSILIALRTTITGTTFLMQLSPDLPFWIGSRVATAVIPLCVMTFQAYSYYFFSPLFPKRPHQILMIMHGGYLALAIFAPSMVYTSLFAPYFWIITSSCLLIAGTNIDAIIKGFKYSFIFIAGLFFVFAGVANDMLHYLQIINTGYYLTLWFSLFIVAQSSMLAIKFSNEHKMVEDLSERLRLLDRLKDEFIANTSHELKTPINGIIGISDSLIDGVTGNLPIETIRNLKLISSSAKRLFSLINDILDYSKLKSKKITITEKNIDLKQMVAVVLTVIKATIPLKEIELINVIGDPFPLVIGDENRLQQILYNLIGNAVKFTEKGHVKISANEQSDHVIVFIEDTGMGIPESLYDDIFRSFEQGDGNIDRQYGGTGLGLPITKKLVELQSGRIGVQSVEGKGSVFSFTMKKSTDTKDSCDEQTIISKAVMDSNKIFLDMNKPIQETSTPAINNTGERILIVDDEAINIQVLQNYLSIEKYRTAYATNGLEAIRMIEAETFDLILLDIMMPRMSGYDVCRQIRKSHTTYELPVIMLTARNQNHDIVAAFQSGANDYLIKPTDRLELIARIKTQLSLRYAVKDAIKNAHLANTDGLTGLYNRRFLIEYGKREFKNALLHKKQLSVIMIDIDHFKKINDHYGHAQGDTVLQHLANILTKNIRGVDMAARYGGEEFIIILSSTAKKGAGRTAEKIRELTEHDSVKSDNNDVIQYTISLGVASIDDKKTCVEDVINEADRMLYQSKKIGRNRVSISPNSRTKKQKTIPS